MISISTTSLLYVAAVVMALCIAYFVLHWRSRWFRQWCARQDQAYERRERGRRR
jgi:antibiotic biosynthesis monooxygenase (ABM) superfamily enzyme